MQTQDNQSIIDSIMSNVKNWNFSPYKTPSGIPLSGGGEFAHQNPLGTQSQNLLPNKAEPQTWWEKTKKFAGTPLGRSLIATGLTGGLTAAFGGSPLQAVSYGAQAGGKASSIYSNSLNNNDKMNQEQAKLQQKAFDNEQNRKLRMDQMQTNAELRKSLADIAYERALGLNEQKNNFNVEGDYRRRDFAVEDRDLDYDMQKATRERGYEHDMTMAGISQAYDIEKAQQSLDNQMTMALLNGDIDKAAEIHKASLNFINSLKLKQEESKLNAAQPTDKMKNYDYFMDKNEPDMARGIGQGNSNPQSEYDKTLERERAKAEIKTAQSIKEIQNQTANAIGNIQYAKKLVEDNKNLVGIYSPYKTTAGRLTNGYFGMSPEELQIRGDISRTIGQLKNNLIAEARSQGQVGINTAREIEQATAGLNDKSSAEELLGALNTMERQAKQLEQIKMQNANINLPFFSNTSGNTLQNQNTQDSQTTLDLSDPRVQKALQNGYTKEEIQAYLGGNNG